MHYVLEKLYFDDMDKVDERTAYLTMKHGFIFEATIYNHEGDTDTYFACANWRGLFKACRFAVGMSISFDIGSFLNMIQSPFLNMIKTFRWICA